MFQISYLHFSQIHQEEFNEVIANNNTEESRRNQYKYAKMNLMKWLQAVTQKKQDEISASKCTKSILIKLVQKITQKRIKMNLVQANRHTQRKL